MKSFENTLIAIMLFCSIFAFGQPDMENIKSQPYLEHKEHLNCDSAITTLELRICANLKYQKSDSLLNDIYQKIISEIENEYLNIDEALFQRSQEEWKEYRDSHCNIYWEMYDGGSFQSVVYMECLADITNERISRLKEILEFY